jgi:hypothetical protein
VREAEKAAALKVVTATATVGEPLKNVNVYAGRPDPIALSDSEYPAWLHTEVVRPSRLDPYRFKKEGILPTRTELRLINKTRIRQNNEETGA